jgi:DtxR family Mn-dependent transcriptional regulator
VPKKTATAGPRLSASAQDYLEAVWVAGQERGKARVSEIAARLGVRMPSVVLALKGLAGKGLVAYEHYGLARLTRTGRAEARRIYERHEGLRRFLGGFLGVDAATAEADACRIEHALSARTMRRLRRFLEFVGDGSPGSRPCAAEFRDYLATGRRRRCSGGQ